MLWSNFLLLTIGTSIVLGRDLRNGPKQNHVDHRAVGMEPKLLAKFMSDGQITPPGLPPVLTHIFQLGSNLFYKPQIMFPALAVAPSEPLVEDCKESEEISDNVVIEAADPQFNDPIDEPVEEIPIEEECVHDPPALPAQFIEAEKISEPFIIPPARPLQIPVLPERPASIVFETSPLVYEIETEEFTPIKVPAAPTLPPFGRPPPIPLEIMQEECITPVEEEIVIREEIPRIPLQIPTSLCMVCTDNNIYKEGSSQFVLNKNKLIELAIKLMRPHKRYDNLVEN